jgi:HK97 family phage major capsid protein
MNLADFACLGMPIVATEKCSAVGTVGDVILADFSHYIIGDRGLEISASREAYGYGGYGFLTDETFWRVVLRVDGQPLTANPITPYLGGATFSPFVCLTTSS